MPWRSLSFDPLVARSCSNCCLKVCVPNVNTLVVQTGFRLEATGSLERSKVSRVRLWPWPVIYQRWHVITRAFQKRDRKPTKHTTRPVRYPLWAWICSLPPPYRDNWLFCPHFHPPPQIWEPCWSEEWTDKDAYLSYNCMNWYVPQSITMFWKIRVLLRNKMATTLSHYNGSYRVSKQI